MYMSGDKCPGGTCPGGLCPRTVLNIIQLYQFSLIRISIK